MVSKDLCNPRPPPPAPAKPVNVPSDGKGELAGVAQLRALRGGGGAG